MPPKQHRLFKVCTPHDLRKHPMVSGTKRLAADPWNPVRGEVVPPWIGRILQHMPQMRDRIEIWEFIQGTWRPSRHFELCQVSQTIPEQYFQCGRVILEYHCHNGVHLFCNNDCHDPRFQQDISQSMVLSIPHCAMVQFWYLCANCRHFRQGQGISWDSYWSVATQQAAVHCVFKRLSIITSINSFIKL